MKPTIHQNKSILYFDWFHHVMKSSVLSVLFTFYITVCKSAIDFEKNNCSLSESSA